MSELGEVFKEWHEVKKEKKQSNLEYNTKLLINKGILFESKNNGLHLVITHKEETIDFWPSTGLFWVRKCKQGRGIKNLIKLLD